ncbi:Citrate transporter-like domain - like 3 [Theobroma cacao]|uniref:Divalent ion symporter isoform 1 n=2 Tax=Theobroma cacao TaxID=3641 RepID=A0A061G896_THECC|nr:Divalent ion symporter isoform 1 [Theobroma cacao]EOY23251.1 Divalent ion symporter isoform 1 [Theobroma cacao]EOY23253.1 Divalent ion symporter isoform 1 [Theobroma cacao]WRX17342.1 Citrate transporter-like domain - like 3 [Theobroma cacao]
MAMASYVKLILGSIAFAIFWVLAVFPAVPCLPIGRTAGSLLGGMLMVIFQVLTVDQAYEAIDLSILGLLFGTMVVSGYLESADAFKYLGKLLTWKSKGAKDLICRICLISAISSAFFTNDTSCMVLTEFVLKIARQKNLPPQPFLLALASSANIGSTATPIGNPQNLVIATQSGISFGEFLTGILPATILGSIVNALLLICMYWNLLSVKIDEEDSAAQFLTGDGVSSHHFSPATMSRLASSSSQGRLPGLEITNVLTSPHVNGSVNLAYHDTLRNRVNSDQGETEIHGFLNGPWESRNSNCSERWKRKLWKSCVYLVVVGMLISLLMGLNMSGTAISAALALMILDFKDAVPCLEKVSYSLLIFFCGMFVTVQGFNKTGIPSALWELMEPYAKIDQVSGMAVLALVILVLSNLVSNVPTVLLLGARMAASAALISTAFEKKAWLILSWVSTVAGNLSLLGSAANLIVCEQACRVPNLGYTLTFWSHLKFGVPSTLLVTAIGLILIKS